MAGRDTRGGEAAEKRWRIVSTPRSGAYRRAVEARRGSTEGLVWVPTIAEALSRAGNPPEHSLRYCRVWMAGFLKDRIYGYREGRANPGKAWLAGWHGGRGYYWIEEDTDA